MSSLPSLYVLFAYDPLYGTQIVLNSSNVEQTLVDYVESLEKSTDYYSIYKLHSIEFYFGSTQKGIQYQYVRKLKGKKNSGAFPYSPFEYAIKFENAHDWFYKSH